MKADYVHKDTLTVTDYVELKKNNELLISYNQALLKENQSLKKQLEEKNNSQIFIDTQDMEERYAEGLYQDYLEEENKKYKEVIDKVSTRLEYFLIGNLKYQSSQEEFIKLLYILKEVE